MAGSEPGGAGWVDEAWTDYIFSPDRPAMTGIAIREAFEAGARAAIEKCAEVAETVREYGKHERWTVMAATEIRDAIRALKGRGG